MRAAAKVGIPGAEGASSELSPFLFRLDPAIVTQFGTARSASLNVPTVAAMIDTDGRPFVRVTSPLDSAAKMLPLLDSNGAKVVASGRFRIEMRARWTAGLNASMRAGVAFNVDQSTAALTCYALCNGTDDGTAFDSFVSGVAEGQLTSNATTYDHAVDWEALFADVWLSPSTGYCTYQYGPMQDAIGADLGIQRRKTVLVTAGGTALGVYCTGGTGYLDIAELIVWRNERNW